MKLLKLLILVASISSAHAIPVQWTLENVVFERTGWYEDKPGGYVTGSFIYDADTNVYSNIDIKTYTSDGNSAVLYNMSTGRDPATPVQFGDASIVHLEGLGDIGSPYGATLLTLGFVENLTNAGGTVSLWRVSEDLSPDFFQTDPAANAVVHGVSVIPVPAAVWLFGSALAGLGWMRRKQSA